MKQEDANQPIAADVFHWDNLSQLHPGDLCNRTDALYHPTEEGYILPVYHLRYLITPKTRKILRVDRNDQIVDEKLHPFFVLIVLVYLTGTREIKPDHRWVSEKDLKGGINFFQGPHSLQLRELEVLYGKDPKAFLEAGRRLGEPKFFMGTRHLPSKYFPESPSPTSSGKAMKSFPRRSGFYSIRRSSPTFPSISSGPWSLKRADVWPNRPLFDKENSRLIPMWIRVNSNFKFKERAGRWLRRTFSPKGRWERPGKKSPFSDWAEKESSGLMTRKRKRSP